MLYCSRQSNTWRAFHHAIVQVAEFVADDAMPQWVAAFWREASLFPDVLSHDAVQLMLQQQHDLQHRLAQLHPEVVTGGKLNMALARAKCPHPLVLAYACLHARKSAQPAQTGFPDQMASPDDGLQCELADSRTCRAIIDACPHLVDLHNVPVCVQVDMMGRNKLAPQLGTLRRFASPQKGKTAAVIPALASMTFEGAVPSARCAPVVCKRAVRLLNAAEPYHLRKLSLAGTHIGDVALAKLAPAVLRLTALTELNLHKAGLGPAGACLLAGILPRLPWVQVLSLGGMELPFWPEAKRSEASLGMALFQMKQLVHLDLAEASSERACIGASNNVLAYLGRSKTLRRLNVAAFRNGGYRLTPPYVPHLTSLTFLQGTLTSQQDDVAPSVPAPQRMCAHIAKLTKLRALMVQGLGAAHVPGIAITADELEQMGNALRALPHLTLLMLDRQGSMDAGPHAVAALHRDIAHMSQLHMLGLDAPFAALRGSLLAAIVQLSRLETLHLSVPLSATEAGHVVMPTVSCNAAGGGMLQRLQSVRCRWPVTVNVPVIGQQIDIEAVTDLIVRCPALKELDLAGLPISDPEGVQLAVALARATALMALRLPLSQGRGDGVKAIAKSAAGMPRLSTCAFGDTSALHGLDAAHAEILVPASTWDEVLDILLPAWQQHNDVSVAQQALHGPQVLCEKVAARVRALRLLESAHVPEQDKGAESAMEEG